MKWSFPFEQKMFTEYKFDNMQLNFPTVSVIDCKSALSEYVFEEPLYQSKKLWH